MAEKFESKRLTTFKTGEKALDGTIEVIVEEPLSIRVSGKPYVVVMRTPGEELYLCAGFCFTEGLVDSPDDIKELGFCTEEGTNVATVTLTSERQEKIAGLLERKGFVSQTSCGICGKELVGDLKKMLSPIKETFTISAGRVMSLVDRFPKRQALNKKTRGAHAAMLFNADAELLCMAEDVGRHNSLDKAIGMAMMNRRLEAVVMGVVSSRLSYELVQKAGRAGIEVLVGLSRPTTLAVEMAEAVNMTLVCVQSGTLMVFANRSRIFR